MTVSTSQNGALTRHLRFRPSGDRLWITLLACCDGGAVVGLSTTLAVSASMPQVIRPRGTEVYINQATNGPIESQIRKNKTMVLHTAVQNIVSRIIAGLMMTVVLLSACKGTPPAKTYTIGVVNYVSVLEPVLEGFKARMTELGYVEDQNIRYLYHGILRADSEVITHEVQSLLKQKVDLFLTLGTLPTLAAKQVVEDTNIPVVFAPVINPVEEGIVKSITHPGGNITGIQNGNTLPKSLEWLHNIVPEVRTIYVFYHSQDRVALTSVKAFPEIAAALGFQLMLSEVQSPQEAIATIQSLPQDAAIFLAPAPRLEPLTALIGAAVARRIAVAAQNPRYIQGGVLVAYAPDPSSTGRQAARLVDQIFKGTRPTDLPVETAEYFLNINLRSANLIGLQISDEILRQAHTVTR